MLLEAKSLSSYPCSRLKRKRVATINRRRQSAPFKNKPCPKVSYEVLSRPAQGPPMGLALPPNHHQQGPLPPCHPFKMPHPLPSLPQVPPIPTSSAAYHQWNQVGACILFSIQTSGIMGNWHHVTFARGLAWQSLPRRKLWRGLVYGNLPKFPMRL